MFQRLFSSRDKTPTTALRAVGSISVEQLQKELETAHGDWARFLLRLAEMKVRSGEIRLAPPAEFDIPIDLVE